MEISTQQEPAEIDKAPGSSRVCLLDLLRSDTSSSWASQNGALSTSGPRRRLENFLSESGNKLCADCGCPDPKWASTNLGVFICIKCSGVHRSLGTHVSKVLSVKLDQWSDEQVDALVEMGGNIAANMKYEASIPDNFRKPKPESSMQERSDFIRRKYEVQQFSDIDDQLFCILPSRYPRSPSTNSFCLYSGPPQDKKQSAGRIFGLGQAFRNSWKRKEPENKTTKKTSSLMGMIEFVGLIKVNVVKGRNLAVRDVVTSDPYVTLTLGEQTVKTSVVKSSLNPVWNESLMLSIPENIPPLTLEVYDKDKFSTDDFMGEAEIDIQPLVSAAKAYENSGMDGSLQLGKWMTNKENSTLIKDSVISLINGNVCQEVTLKLQKVETGLLEIELECVPLTH